MCSSGHSHLLQSTFTLCESQLLLTLDDLMQAHNATVQVVTIFATLRWAPCGPGTTGRPAQGCDYCTYDPSRRQYPRLLLCS